MTDDSVASPELEPDEREELERLRAEVVRLRARERPGDPGGGGGASPGSPWRGRGRTAGAALLIVLAVVLAPRAVAAVWARSQVTDTERYVQTVAPLAGDPAVQKAIADSITDRVFAYIDVRGLTSQAVTGLADRGSLPPELAPQLRALAVPLANGVRDFTENQVLNVVHSDAFERAWVQANRTAHEQLVAALTGRGGSTVSVEGDAVRVDLAAFITVVKERLVSSGFELAERIPTVNAQFTIFRSADVTSVQRGFDLLDTAGLWLPFVCLLLVGLGIYLARDHRLAFIGAGLGLAVAMVLTGAALALARRAYLDGVPPEILAPDAAAVLYDTFVRFLRDAVRAGALIGLIVAVGAFVWGPSVTATTIRRGIDAVLAAAKGGLGRLGLDLSAVTERLAPHARVLRAAVLAVVLAVVFLERYRTPELVLRATAAGLVALALVQFLAITPRFPGRPPRNDESDAATEATDRAPTDRAPTDRAASV